MWRSVCVLCSVYNVWERSGVRGFVIPASHKPGLLNPELCKTLQGLIGRADKFIQKQQQQPQPSQLDSRPPSSRAGTASSVRLCWSNSSCVSNETDSCCAVQMGLRVKSETSSTGPSVRSPLLLI